MHATKEAGMKNFVRHYCMWNYLLQSVCCHLSKSLTLQVRRHLHIQQDSDSAERPSLLWIPLTKECCCCLASFKLISYFSQTNQPLNAKRNAFVYTILPLRLHLRSNHYHSPATPVNQPNVMTVTLTMPSKASHVCFSNVEAALQVAQT